MDGGRWDDLDAATALALLEWQAEMGADEPALDAPLDRFAMADRPPAAAAAPAPLAASPAMVGPATAAPQLSPGAAEPDLDALVAEAQRMADAAPTLEDLAAAQERFDGIELKKGARRFVFADGNPAARVLILGEAPGDEEDRQGRPFVGRAGQLLDLMFAAIGMARDHVDATRALYITNILPWRPPGNRDPSDAEMAMMMPFVRRHVELAAPDLVVLMGNTPCQAALGRRGILRLRGNWTEAFGRPAMPMTHPAYLLRNPVAKRESWADLLSVQARLESLSV
ncbi:MAG: uracil-DNA glycosylase [Paracoccus sp. (in: a-proteobacteria)]|uniref:uracil-DNA glycosylase n=1 Tax=Paracoccus sp. TaxID=267 RepID=UPI0026E068FA|nr:uracil-DNA glycosylase [Paracoccus sp. (in: a-proteobacteria)]MDO5612732.1 uracil-DNA glycosylase [Paracoccus sp. (in: a-proteobacteria)]